MADSTPPRWADPDVIARFWSKVRWDAGCLIWVAGKNGQSYGHLWVDKSNVRAHILAWEIEYDQSVPDGLELDHLCRRRECVHAGHLEAVSHRINVHRGDKTKLDAVTVKRIREMARFTGLTWELIAEQVGHHVNTVISAGTGRNWKDLPYPIAPRRQRKRGEANGQAKLIEDDVRSIRSAYATGLWTQRELAEEFDVDPSLIGYIIRRELWRHID